MKLGLVGVGRWGKTLARKFKEAGHEILFYDRLQSSEPVEGLGQRLPWVEMHNWVDAMVIAATPPITAEIALLCAMNGFPVVATKPLLNVEEMVIKRKPAPFAVDYVHLHSPIMKELYNLTDKKKSSGISIEKVKSEFWGQGPVRVMGSLFDYGPHAISTVLELTTFRSIDVKRAYVDYIGDRERWTINGRSEDVEVDILTGNGASDERCRLTATFSDGTVACYDEQFPKAYLEVNGKKIKETEKHDPLREFIDEFADHMRAKGSAMTEAAAQSDLAMSVDVLDTINKIRRAADDSR